MTQDNQHQSQHYSQKDINNLILRLQILEEKLQRGELTVDDIKTTSKELGTSIQELRGIINSIDTRLSIEEKEYEHLSSQITKLEKTIQALEDVNSKESDHKRDIVENIFMVVIGAVVTYLFGLIRS